MLDTVTAHPEWRILDFPLVARSRGDFSDAIPGVEDTEDVESSFLF